MERFVGSQPDTASSLGYVSWEEVNVSSDRGRREVHYYLKRIDGGSDLAVVGKERSLRHMSYHCTIKDRSFLLSMGPFPKLKSRREVTDWLNSVVSGLSPHEVSHLERSWNNSDSSELDVGIFKHIQLQRLGQYSKEFLWLGSAWTCNKRRKHYESFCRNGVKVSVHDFVYVLAEEDKQLVAYLEDMYEDAKGNKMVMVRWFHKIDEVDVVLPHNFSDREIFFSLCLQDLSIECIDGLATVLSPQHFEKFWNEARHVKLHPFFCHKMFENECIKPFNITKIKGYWNQEALRYIYTAKDRVNYQQLDVSPNVDRNADDAAGMRPRKRHRRSRDDVMYNGNKELMDSSCVDVCRGLMDCKSGDGLCTRREGDAVMAMTEAKPNTPQYLKVGSEVEVLSQDSGIRGCWFRALIIKKHKDKVKVRYQDIKDAADEANQLEEWIMASKVAAPDHLGSRTNGRTVVRPTPQLKKGKVSWIVDIGTAVDVWQHDAWWEGVVIRKESEDKFHVYFPGEKRESIFSRADLRHSEEWLRNEWTHIKEMPDIATSVLSCFETKKPTVKSCESDLANAAITKTSQPGKIETGCCDSSLDSVSGKGEELRVVSNLAKDDWLAQLRWKSSRKRRRSRSHGQNMHNNNNCCSKSWKEVIRSNASERMPVSMALKVDHENCKYMGDSLFSSAVVQPLTSLVMSRG